MLFVALLLTTAAIVLYQQPSQRLSAYPYPPTRLTIIPVTPDSIPTRLQILQRELDVPVETPKQMTPRQIQFLIEQNAERLGVRGGRLEGDDSGNERWILFGYAPTNPACPPIQRGLDFLMNQHNPSLGLLRESPVVAHGGCYHAGAVAGGGSAGEAQTD
jgi:hypothetical protein